jgi:hypothetical protein
MKNPIVRFPRDLLYSQVVTHRDERGRITSIERTVVFGTLKRFQAELAQMEGCYTIISTAHTEEGQPHGHADELRLVRETLYPSARR